LFPVTELVTILFPETDESASSSDVIVFPAILAELIELSANFDVGNGGTIALVIVLGTHPKFVLLETTRLLVVVATTFHWAPILDTSDMLVTVKVDELETVPSRVAPCPVISFEFLWKGNNHRVAVTVSLKPVTVINRFPEQTLGAATDKSVE
jgi:hypothetical protein